MVSWLQQPIYANKNEIIRFPCALWALATHMPWLAPPQLPHKFQFLQSKKMRYEDVNTRIFLENNYTLKNLTKLNFKVCLFCPMYILTDKISKTYTCPLTPQELERTKQNA